MQVFCGVGFRQTVVRSRSCFDLRYLISISGWLLGFLLTQMGLRLFWAWQSFNHVPTSASESNAWPWFRTHWLTVMRQLPPFCSWPVPDFHSLWSQAPFQFTAGSVWNWGFWLKYSERPHPLKASAWSPISSAGFHWLLKSAAWRTPARCCRKLIWLWTEISSEELSLFRRYGWRCGLKSDEFELSWLFCPKLQFVIFHRRAGWKCRHFARSGKH